MTKIKTCNDCGQIHSAIKCPRCKSDRYTETQDESVDLKDKQKDMYLNNPIRRIIKYKKQI